MDPIYGVNPSYDHIILSKKALSTEENTPCTRWTQLVKGVVQGGRNLSKGVVQVDANRKKVPKIRYKFDQ